MTEHAPTRTLAAPARQAGSRVLAFGAYRPERIVTNDEICEHIDSSDQWIRERSGIVTRRFAAPDESVVDMAQAASEEAIEAAGIDRAEIGLVLVATVSHPYQTPAAAPLLASRLGLANPPAMDISAACAGYCHGIALANDAVTAGTAKYVLVIGVEKLSDFTDPTDRGTAFIFADGAGAVVIGPADEPEIGPTVWGSDGDQWDVIAQRESWTELRAGLASGDRSSPAWPNIGMAGQTVFRWAVWSMAKVAQQALDAAGITVDELDVFLPHQANLRIIDAMAKQLKLPEHVVIATDIIDSGNTSAASIPLAGERLIREGKAKSGDLALQIGYGAGLSYAAQVIRLP